MKESEQTRKINLAVYRQCKGYAALADVLVDIGMLPKKKYEEWRFGKVNYLELACSCNLKNLSFIMKYATHYVDRDRTKKISLKQISGRPPRNKGHSKQTT